jgi:hypothetical protein
VRGDGDFQEIGMDGNKVARLEMPWWRSTETSL